MAWNPLGWKASWLAEIEPFPSAVLAHHYPEVPNLGDMTTIAKRVLTGEVEAPDVFCGGTPCQAFSVAGLRQSLDDARGNLSLKFVELADAIDHVRVRSGKPASIVFWENVPGVLSTKDNAFGCFLAGLAGEDEPLQPPGEKWANAGCVYGPARAIAWRTLDAQYTGVAQRRRRVFVVASARAGFDPAQVLFEWDGSRRDTAPSRKAGEGTAHGVEIGPGGGRFTDLSPTLDTRAKDGPIRNQLAPAVMQMAFGGNKTSGPRDISSALSALSAHGGTGRHDFESETFVTQFGPVAGTLTARHDSSPCADRGMNVVSVLAFDTTQITSVANRSNPKAGDPCHPLAAGDHPPAIAFNPNQEGMGISAQVAAPIGASTGGGNQGCVAFPANLSGTQHASTEDLSPALGALNPTAVAVALRGREGGATAELGDEVQNCLRASGGGGDKAYVLAPTVGTLSCNTGPNGHGAGNFACNQAVDAGHVLPHAMQVRRLTPVECARLQGFPDDYLDITVRGKPAKDRPKYKALGNSWAVPCARWIGKRIDAAMKDSE